LKTRSSQNFAENVVRVWEFIFDALTVGLRTPETPYSAPNAEKDYQRSKNRRKELNGSVKVVAISMNWMSTSAWPVVKK